MKIKLFFILLLSAVFLFSDAIDKYTLGGLVREDGKSPSFITEKQIEAEAEVNSSFFITEGIPPVGNQSSLGSCTCWALGYYYKTFQEWQEHDWDVTDPAHQFSPSFLYNQLNGGANYGSFVDDVLLMIEKYGICTMSDMPYTTNYSVYPDRDDYLNSMYYRSSESHYTLLGDLTQLKQHLSNGELAVFHIYVYDNFYSISSSQQFYAVSLQSGVNRGGHVVTLVGFDDSIATPDGYGAFRCVNSWGTSWGDNGYWWITYQAIKYTTYVPIQRFWWSDDRIDYTPQLYVELNVSHNKRDIINLALFSNNETSPNNLVFINDWYMDGYRTSYPSTFHDYPFPSNDILYDISDFYLLKPDSLFFAMEDTITDSESGYLNSFRAIRITGEEYTAYDTPIEIFDLDFNDSGILLDSVASALSQRDDTLLNSQSDLKESSNKITFDCSCSILCIHANSSISKNVYFYDVSGRRVGEINGAEIHRGSNKINLNYLLSPGVYFIRSGDFTILKITLLD